MAVAKRRINNIEAESLEAHVALCAERYQSMNDKLDNLNDRVGKMETVIQEIKTYIVGLEKTAMSKLLGWAGWAIASLLSAIIALGAYEYKNITQKLSENTTQTTQQ
jgi:hypothetical protein